MEFIRAAPLAGSAISLSTLPILELRTPSGTDAHKLGMNYGPVTQKSAITREYVVTWART
jgi:hypothetical protein